MEKIIERFVAAEFRDILMAGPIVDFSGAKTEAQCRQIEDRFAEFDRLIKQKQMLKKTKKMKRCRERERGVCVV
jgi:hypothetical protein